MNGTNSLWNKRIMQYSEFAKFLASSTTAIRDEINDKIIEGNSDSLNNIIEDFIDIFNLSKFPILEQIDSIAQILTYITIYTSYLKVINRTNNTIEETLQMFLQIDKKTLDDLLTESKMYSKLLNEVQNQNLLLPFNNYSLSKQVGNPGEYFFEEFLKEYKPSLRIKKGIFYTPLFLIDFVIRLLDQLLKSEFMLEKGIFPTKSANLVIIDPALGTGTFLTQIIEYIHENYLNDRLNLRKDSLINHENFLENIVQTLFGIELLAAPLSIARLNVVTSLRSKGYSPLEIRNLNLFSEDSLNNLNLYKKILKRQSILLIVGNPPFSGHSNNESHWIQDLLHGVDEEGKQIVNYFLADKKPLGEKNPKWLNDDYVKFIRLAHWLIEQNGQGIISFITNHSFIDNPTFRGMRQQLLNTFTDIYLLDLHGNLRKKEIAPNSLKDENIFDIKQGVCIAFFIRNPKKKSTRIVQYDVWGTREEKISFLNTNNLESIHWKEVNPTSPWFLFYPIDNTRLNEYLNGWKITDIFQNYSVGIMTGNDKLTIHNKQEEVIQIIKDLVNISENQFRVKYNLEDESRQWRYQKAKEDVMRSIRYSNLDLDKIISENVVPIHYRPFDIRFTYYTGRSRGIHERPRGKIMNQMLWNTNRALIISRSSKPAPWRDVLTTNLIIELGIIATRPGNNAPLFPLFIQKEPKKSRLELNFTNSFIGFIKTHHPQFNPSPLQIFNFITAFLHSEIFRTRYEEFLKIDFPFIHFPKSKEIFIKLGDIGEEIFQLQKGNFLKSNKLSFVIENSSVNDIIEEVTITEEGIVKLNNSLFLKEIPKSILFYSIGSYQVCRKWLKKYKKEKFTKELALKFNELLLIIREMINISKRIDLIINEEGGWEEVFIL